MSILVNGLFTKLKLDTVKDIQKAIQYFPMVPEAERNQAASLITMAILRLGQTIRVSERNPIVKYLKKGTHIFIDWDYDNTYRKDAQYTIVPDYILQGRIIASLGHYINANFDSEIIIDTSAHMMIDKIFNRSNNGGDICSLYRPDVYNKNITQYAEHGRNIPMVWYCLNNIVMNYCNKMVLSFMNDAGEDIDELYLMNAYMLDMNEMIMRREQSDEELVRAIHSYTRLINHLPQEFKGIYYLLIKKIDTDNLPQDCKTFLNEIRIKISSIFLVQERNPRQSIFKNTSHDLAGYIQSPEFLGGTNVINTLERFRDEVEDELFINFTDVIPSKKYIFQHSEAIQSPYFNWLKNTIEYLCTVDISKFRRTMLNYGFNLNITKDIMYALKKANIIKTFIQNPYQALTLGCMKKTCYIVATKNGKVYLIPIFTGNELSQVRNIVEMNKRLTVRVIEFNNNTPVDMVASDMMLIESTNKIEFDKDTNLKFKFKRTDRNTYMNRYSDIHTVLVQNSRNKNYQAMKTDLARLYGLIYIIERDVTHSTKAVSPSVKADGTKARMFAKNDLKRYMEEVIVHDKNFDLSKYFEESGVKNQIEKEYEVKINTLGVKKLIKTLM